MDELIVYLPVINQSVLSYISESFGNYSAYEFSSFNSSRHK